MGLYSNAAAVLSEAVANTWDADAKLVEIDIGPKVITIEDNGVGMDLDAINNRFLSVGYNKRATEGEKSKNGRPFMGRKGIGKLALFSIAGTIEVHTRRANGERHAFKMVTKDIRTAVKAGKNTTPFPSRSRDRSEGRGSSSANSPRSEPGPRSQPCGSASRAGSRSSATSEQAAIVSASRSTASQLAPTTARI